MRKIPSFWILVLLVLALIIPLSVSAQDDIAGDVEILWDTWGVPHIYAENSEALFYGYGYAQMTSHANRILDLYIQSRGDAALFYGADYTRQDVFVRILNVPDLAQTWYDGQTEEFATYLDAFAAGMNAYAEAHPEAIDDDLAGALPITNLDALKHGIFASQFGFIASRAFGQIFGWPPPSEEDTNGSNTWAIAPERSESGNTLLVQNPHLEWSGANTFYEAQLNSPDISIYGATLLGWPVVVIGFNDNHGWSHTVNTHDGYDLYELEISAVGQYEYDGEMLQAEVAFLSIPVLQEDGSVENISQISATTLAGPLVAQSDDGRALALRVVSIDSDRVFNQWWDMGRATNIEEFTEAISQLELATQTIMYADRDGNIMHVFNGQIPIRDQGDFNFWREILPGNTSEFVWNEYHPFEDLPRVTNPESGWLQNANEAPWTTTFPLAINYEDYPAYFAPEPFMTWRAQSSASMLYDDASITYEELVEYKHSTEMELAARIMDDLLLAVSESDNEVASAAADILANWDLRTDADSQGAVLFLNWYELYRGMVEGDGLATEFDLNAEPFTTPDGLSNPEMAVTALAEAGAMVEATYGAMDVPWGDVYRLRVNDYDLPANGGSGALGEFRVVGYRAQEDGTFSSYRGDSYVGIIEFSDPIRAQVLVSYGNSSQADSPHYGDQLELFAQQELRDAWITREAVEANLEMAESLSMD